MKNISEILENVKNGSALYISIGEALIREFPLLSGATAESRVVGRSNKTMAFDGVEFELEASVTFAYEDVSSEILAYNKNGEPLMFKNKYGKGSIFVLTAPLEKYLADKKCAFSSESELQYDLIYRKIAECAGITRLADTDSPFVRATEHKINENSAYVFLINYSNKRISTKIKIENGYIIEAIAGNCPENGIICLEGNDGCIFKLKKKRI